MEKVINKLALKAYNVFTYGYRYKSLSEACSANNITLKQYKQYMGF